MSSTSAFESVLAAGSAQAVSLEQMQRWGAEVGAVLPSNSIITLSGDVGAGKTTLARALCIGAGVFDTHTVTSPTFSIVHEYRATRGLIVHADLYRLNRDSELDAIGWDEMLNSAFLVIVEWPDRVSRGWPVGTVAISLQLATSASDSRMISVTGVPDSFRARP